jgi:hypothetical protein
MQKYAAGILLFAGCLTAFGAAADPSTAEIDKIIHDFAAKESEFAKARENYTYRQSVKVQELDPSGNPGGKFEVITDIVFNQDGKRNERVVRAPMTTLQFISISPEDEQDLRSVQPFVLTSKDIDKYLVRYLGRQTLDEIGCYMFSVKPKKMESGQRYFQGQIWVDDRDLQIVKTYGRAVGILKHNSDQAFPKFETYREQVDGKYWFPTYTIANDTLNFKENSQRIKMTVKYEDYKQFKSDVKLSFGDEVKDENPPKK